MGPMGEHRRFEIDLKGKDLPFDQALLLGQAFPLPNSHYAKISMTYVSFFFFPLYRGFVFSLGFVI